MPIANYCTSSLHKYLGMPIDTLVRHAYDYSIGQRHRPEQESDVPQQWTSSPISLADGLVIEVQVTSEGVTCRKSVDGVYASDLLLTPEQAERYGKALIEGATRAMRK